MKRLQPGEFGRRVKLVKDILQQEARSEGGDAGAAEGQARERLRRVLEEVEALLGALEEYAEEIARERQRYAEFFDLVADAYLITDCDAGIRLANQAAAKLLRADRESLVGESLTTLVTEEARKGFRTRFISLRGQATKRTNDWQTTIRRLDATAMSVTLSVNAIVSPNRGPADFCWLIRAE